MHALVLAVALPICSVAACAALSVGVGWAVPTLQPRAEDTAAKGHTSASAAAVLFSFCRAAGEELGWRCWLLPRLDTIATVHASTTHAVLGHSWISTHIGVAWG